MTPQSWYDHARRAIAQERPKPTLPTLVEFLNTHGVTTADRICGNEQCEKGCQHHGPAGKVG